MVTNLPFVVSEGCHLSTRIRRAPISYHMFPIAATCTERCDHACMRIDLGGTHQSAIAQFCIVNDCNGIGFFGENRTQRQHLGLQSTSHQKHTKQKGNFSHSFFKNRR